MTGRPRTEATGGGDERHPFDFDPKLLGDPDADEDVRKREWSGVYRYFDPKLRLFFRRRVAAPELDDLVQEIWRRALLNIGSLESPRAAWTWLSTVGVNLLRDQGRARAADARRREAFARSCQESVIEDEVLERLFEDPFEGRVERAVFGGRLASLTDLDRRLLHLFAVEERSHEEIAIILNLASAAASRQRLRRIRQVLRGE
jgi:RNA polymerase sigma factor (sigma-70 family)